MWLCMVKHIFHFVQWRAAGSICTHTNDCYLCLTVAQVCASVRRANTHRLKELQHQAAGVQPGPTMDLCTVLEGCSSWLWNPSVVWVAVTTTGSQELTASASEVESNARGCIWDRWHWQLLYWDCSPWESAGRRGGVLTGNLEWAGIITGVSVLKTYWIKWVWQRCWDEGKRSIQLLNWWNAVESVKHRHF